MSHWVPTQAERSDLRLKETLEGIRGRFLGTPYTLVTRSTKFWFAANRLFVFACMKLMGFGSAAGLSSGGMEGYFVGIGAGFGALLFAWNIIRSDKAWKKFKERSGKRHTPTTSFSITGRGFKTSIRFWPWDEIKAIEVKPTIPRALVIEDTQGNKTHLEASRSIVSGLKGLRNTMERRRIAFGTPDQLPDALAALRAHAAPEEPGTGRQGDF